jgi:hypothetical protein
MLLPVLLNLEVAVNDEFENLIGHTHGRSQSMLSTSCCLCFEPKETLDSVSINKLTNITINNLPPNDNQIVLLIPAHYFHPQQYPKSDLQR